MPALGQAEYLLAELWRDAGPFSATQTIQSWSRSVAPIATRGGGFAAELERVGDQVLLHLDDRDQVDGGFRRSAALITTPPLPHTDAASLSSAPGHEPSSARSMCTFTENALSSITRTRRWVTRLPRNVDGRG